MKRRFPSRTLDASDSALDSEDPSRIAKTASKLIPTGDRRLTTADSLQCLLVILQNPVAPDLVAHPVNRIAHPLNFSGGIDQRRRYVPVAQLPLHLVDARIDALEQEQQNLNARVASADFYKEGAEAIKSTLARLEEMVLSRGITGDTAGIPKVTCPMHKKSFSLQDGQGLSDDIYSIQTFEVKVEGDDLMVKLPAEENLDRLHICDTREPCTCFA